MTAVIVGLQGAKKMRKELKAAGMDLADLKRPYADAARIVQQAAAPQTPRRTGRLAGTVRSSGTRTAGIVRAGGASVPYANPIHWGWPARGIEAQPWISDAAQATEPRWITEFETAMNDAIGQVKGLA